MVVLVLQSRSKVTGPFSRSQPLPRINHHIPKSCSAHSSTGDNTGRARHSRSRGTGNRGRSRAPKTQGSVEGIRRRLPGQGTRRLLASGTGRNRIRRRVTRAAESLADEAGNHADVQRGAMIEIRLIRRDEGIRVGAVGLLAEVDGRVAAGAETESRATEHLLGADERIAGALLGLALRFAASQFAGVGGVGALVVLDGAGALDGSAAVDEGGAVGREGPAGASGEDDGWG